MNHYAFFRGYICTANADGSIPINAKIVCMTDKSENDSEMRELIAQANLGRDLLEAIKSAHLGAPEITSAVRRYDNATDIKF